MLGLEPGAAGCGSKYANHCFMDAAPKHLLVFVSFQMGLSRTMYRPDSSKFSPVYLPNMIGEMSKGEHGPPGPPGERGPRGDQGHKGERVSRTSSYKLKITSASRTLRKRYIAHKYNWHPKQDNFIVENNIQSKMIWNATNRTHDLHFSAIPRFFISPQPPFPLS